MRIIILGAGRVGESVAESLVSERNDITLIDPDPQRLRELEERLDLRGVAGNGIHPSTLERAGLRRRRHADRLRHAGRDQPGGLQDRARRLQRAHHHRAAALAGVLRRSDRC